MRGDEKRVVDAFCAFLDGEGWATEREVVFVDVRATHPDGRVILAEAKGRTAAMGLDVDCLYGQLLRRMSEDHSSATRFAVVVPESALAAALRVPKRVREVLAIDVYGVTDTGEVLNPTDSDTEGEECDRCDLA